MTAPLKLGLLMEAVCVRDLTFARRGLSKPMGRARSLLWVSEPSQNVATDSIRPFLSLLPLTEALTKASPKTLATTSAEALADRFSLNKTRLLFELCFTCSSSCHSHGRGFQFFPIQASRNMFTGCVSLLPLCLRNLALKEPLSCSGGVRPSSMYSVFRFKFGMFLFSLLCS